jgi:hypothetical protein
LVVRTGKDIAVDEEVTGVVISDDGGRPVGKCLEVGAMMRTKLTAPRLRRKITALSID